MTNPDRKILILWVIAIAMITVDELKNGQPLPRPSRFMGSAVVYGLAAITAEVAADFAVWLAAGWTLAIFYKALANKEAAQNTKPTAATVATPTNTTRGR